MSKFDFNPNDVQANIEVLPADSYTLEITSVKPFERDKTESGGKHTWGIWFSCRVVDGEKANAKVIFNGYMHNENSQQSTKRFLMAVYGYSADMEKEFNNDVASKDWSYSPEDGSIGSIWQETVGKLVIGNLAIQMGNGGMEFQNFKSWQVYGS